MKNLILLLMVILSTEAFARKMPPPSVYIETDKSGHYYAKSIPEFRTETGPKTLIYKAGETDKLLHGYNWYSRKVVIANFRSSVFAVKTKLSKWRIPAEENPQPVVLFSLYKDGSLVKEYTDKYIESYFSLDREYKSTDVRDFKFNEKYHDATFSSPSKREYFLEFTVKNRNMKHKFKIDLLTDKLIGDVRAESALPLIINMGPSQYAEISKTGCAWRVAPCNGAGHRAK